MTHRGKRSMAARQIRFLRRVLWDKAYRDRYRSEAVNLVTKDMAVAMLSQQFGFAEVSVADTLEKGDILIDL